MCPALRVHVRYCVCVGPLCARCLFIKAPSCRRRCRLAPGAYRGDTFRLTSIYRSVCIYIHLYIYIPIYPSIYLSIYIYTYRHLLAAAAWRLGLTAETRSVLKLKDSATLPAKVPARERTERLCKRHTHMCVYIYIYIYILKSSSPRCSRRNRRN